MTLRIGCLVWGKIRLFVLFDLVISFQEFMLRKQTNKKTQKHTQMMFLTGLLVIAINQQINRNKNGGQHSNLHQHRIRYVPDGAPNKISFLMGPYPTVQSQQTMWSQKNTKDKKALHASNPPIESHFIFINYLFIWKSKNCILIKNKNIFIIY